MTIPTSHTSKSNLYHYSKIVGLDQSPSANFYGRVVSFKAPRETRGKDWVMNLIVIDDSFEGKADLNTQNPAGLSINIFKPSPTDFPAVKQVGDIVQFRHFRIQYYESFIQGITTKWSAYTVFRRDGGEGHSWKAFPEREIFPEELEVIEKISKVNCAVFLSPSSNYTTEMPSTETEAAPLIVPQRGPPIRSALTVSEVRHGTYFNGIFKVMKISKSSVENQFSLLVCDYTESPFLSSNPELLDLPSYLNQCLLPVTLWDNFAEEAKRLNLKAGCYVYFDNLLGRQIRHEDGTVNVVAVLHGDPKASFLENYIKIQKESKKIESQAIRLEQLKKSLESEQQIIEAVNPKQEQEPPKALPVIVSKKQQTKRTFSIKTEQTSVRKFTTTSISGDSFAVTTILSVRSFPSDNAKFCVKAKILALIPASFYETVRYVCDKCNCTTPLTRFNADDGTCSNCGTVCSHENPKFIWLFTLIIEDATGDLAIIVADEDATEFLNYSAFNFFALDPKNQNENENENAIRLQNLTSIFSQMMMTSDDQSEHLFCIKSYRVNDEDGSGLSNLRYRLFNTKLI